MFSFTYLYKCDVGQMRNQEQIKNIKGTNKSTWPIDIQRYLALRV